MEIAICNKDDSWLKNFQHSKYYLSLFTTRKMCRCTYELPSAKTTVNEIICSNFFSILVIFPCRCFNLLDFPLYTSNAEVLTSLSGWRNFLKSLGLDFCTFLLDIELGFLFETVGLLWCIHKIFNFLLEALCAFQILA